MAIEYELKYRATQAQLETLREAFSEPEQLFEMETTYYDTASGALSSRHFTLRRRMENGRSVCTVKAPAQGNGRGEWEVEADRIEDAIPALCKLGGPEELKTLVQEGLTPVCGARFQRIAKTLKLENCTVELALDSGVLSGGGREVSLCEAEVELKEGSPKDADVFARILAAKYGLVPESRSKFRRALALSKGEE